MEKVSARATVAGAGEATEQAQETEETLVENLSSI
jgi:hypothetical protein